MGIQLKGRSLLTLRDFSAEEIGYLLNLAVDFKNAKRLGISGDSLKGKNIVLLFEKTSTRTRCAFETAVFDEGGHTTFLTNSQLGKKESLEDTARVLGRMYDGIEFRGFEHSTVEGLARWSGVPVWNGLTDLFHPTQALADAMTVKEYTGKLFNKIKWIYIGDGRNNVANSLLIISAKLGMTITVISPEELFPKESFVSEMREIASENGGEITITSDRNAVSGSDAIYTDVWVSMGEEDKMEERIKLLTPYQVNAALMEKTNNSSALFLHCLPAFHDRNTEVGEMVFQKYGLSEMEVTDEVFRSKASVVFDQAENRVHTIKALMAATI